MRAWRMIPPTLCRGGRDPSRRPVTVARKEDTACVPRRASPVAPLGTGGWCGEQP